jgi:DTW domain-containing protein YfiP
LHLRCDPDARLADADFASSFHVNEIKKSSNTGALALRALVNSEMRVRGETRATLDLSDLLTRALPTFLILSVRGRRGIEQRADRRRLAPVQLIVPDGSWRQAARCFTASRIERRAAREARRASAKYYMRAQHRPEGMATLQAIAHGLGVIEGAARRGRVDEALRRQDRADLDGERDFAREL